ncbi:hypothetical protein HTY61_05625 [Oricola thermophila]|uniref:HAD family hydrolase n=2 Tax=Oricola thermophila TaxID=2742145 RepID=A0A6N1VAK8_9HYPH|nr:hypothetical protein HTY61_05625 [Oricola thermophila]
MTPAERNRIEALARSERPLIICDIDEVVLEFVSPFMAFLESHDHELRTDSFQLTGNVYFKKTGEPADKATISEFLERFFNEHDSWQKPAEGARETLATIEAKHGVDIVYLTAMPPRHHARRRALLDRHGFPHPMIATEEAKGAAVATLIRHHPRRPVAFIDDLPPNHVSVLETVPDALALHLMAYRPLRALLPPMPKGVRTVESWAEAAEAIAEHLSNLAC